MPETHGCEVRSYLSTFQLGLRWLVRRMTGRSTLDRGMSLWHDSLDWIGGFPFEVARPELVFRFYKKKNFVLWK